MTRGAAQLDTLFERLGRDLQLSWAGPAGSFSDADLGVVRRIGPTLGVTDIGVATDLAQADQLIVNRLITRRGELTALGHPEYGSRHHELIGEPNTDRTRNLVKLYVLEALRQEPRIEKVLRCVVRTDPPRPDVVRIELMVRLITSVNPRNLVVPFGLGGGR